MIGLDIFPSLQDGQWADLDGIESGTVARIGRLPKGTKEGNAVVMIVIEMHDGTKVLGQTTLRNMQADMRVIDEREKMESGGRR